MEETNPRRHKRVLRYTYLGTQILVYLAIGVYGGIQLDAWVRTKPLFIILLPALALFWCIMRLYRQLVKKKE